MNATNDADARVLAALGRSDVTRWAHVGSVAEAEALLAAASGAGARIDWIHGGADLGLGAAAGRRDLEDRWLAVVRPIRHCTVLRPDGSLVDVGGGRLWNELDASLRRRGAQLGRWQEHVGALPVGAVLGRAASALDRSAREGWRVQRAVCVADGTVVAWENPSEAQLSLADAILEARLAVRPLRRSAGRQWWRFQDVGDALAALRALGPELGDGLTADLAPAVGLRRGAVWTKAADDGSTWRTALAASLPGAAAFLDRRLRLAERRGWWLRLACDGEPGVVEVRLAGCAAVVRDAGGHLDPHADSDGIADWWPDAQPQVPQVARARGATATWSEQQLDWACLTGTLQANGAARSWLQVGDSDVVGARVQQWCIEEGPLPVVQAESGGQRIGRAIGPKLRSTLQLRRRSGAVEPLEPLGPGAAAEPSSPATWTAWPPTHLGSTVRALPAYIALDDETGCLWATASTTWQQCAERARAAGRRLPAADDVPASVTIAALVREEPEALDWLHARATPWARRWTGRVVRACGVVATDGSLVLPRRAAPAWVGAMLTMTAAAETGPAAWPSAGHGAPSRRPQRGVEVWAVGLRTDQDLPMRRLWWHGSLQDVWRAFPDLCGLASGTERLGVLVEGDTARVCVEVVGSGPRARRVVDLLSGPLRGLRDEPTPWPTERLLGLPASRVAFDGPAPASCCALLVDDERWALALHEPRFARSLADDAAPDIGPNAEARVWT